MDMLSGLPRIIWITERKLTESNGHYLPFHGSQHEGNWRWFGQTFAWLSQYEASFSLHPLHEVSMPQASQDFPNLTWLACISLSKHLLNYRTSIKWHTKQQKIVSFLPNAHDDYILQVNKKWKLRLIYFFTKRSKNK